jgi:hypothetical protein
MGTADTLVIFIGLAPPCASRSYGWRTMLGRDNAFALDADAAQARLAKKREETLYG